MHKKTKFELKFTSPNILEYKGRSSVRRLKVKQDTFKKTLGEKPLQRF